jgi:hypothetical protein
MHHVLVCIMPTCTVHGDNMMHAICIEDVLITVERSALLAELMALASSAPTVKLKWSSASAS